MEVASGISSIMMKSSSRSRVHPDTTRRVCPPDTHHNHQKGSASLAGGKWCCQPSRCEKDKKVAQCFTLGLFESQSPSILHAARDGWWVSFGGLLASMAGDCRWLHRWLSGWCRNERSLQSVMRGLLLQVESRQFIFRTRQQLVWAGD